MKVEEKKHHDEHEVRWGEGPEERDPQPSATLYFVVWGFSILFASIFFLQALAYHHLESEAGRTGTTLSGTLDQMRADQEAQLKRGSKAGEPITQAMADVVKKYGKRK